MDRRRGRDDAQGALPFLDPGSAADDAPPRRDEDAPPAVARGGRTGVVAPAAPAPASAAPAVPRPRRPGDKDHPLSVEALVRAASLLLEEQIGLVWIAGEVSNLRAAGSGHIYFVLKDRGGQVPAIVWRSTAQRFRFRLEEGQKLLVRGRLGVFTDSGKLQLYVENAEPAGLGAAALALEQLKQKLAAEGLFALERKRPLPALPRRIGVVTSPTGAAVRDIIRVIERRFPVPILVSPARVQGEGAAAEICRAIVRLARWDVDVIIVGRGGGSAEELGAFNDEHVVRAIAAARVPVVSAVGHEVDVTLADLVADVRAATPTAAGELCVPERVVMREALAKLERRLVREARHAIVRGRHDVEKLGGRLAVADPRRALARERQQLDELMLRAEAAVDEALARRRRALGQLELRHGARHPRAQLGAMRAALGELVARLGAAGGARVTERRRRFENAAARLDAMSPLKVLERGYAVARRPDGSVVVDAATVAAGEALEVRVARGVIDVRVVGARGPGGAGGAGGEGGEP